MKRYLKHIILFLALLPLMTACVLDSDPTENCSDNEVVVSLSVSSRAVEGSQLDDGLPDDIKLWVYGQKASTDTEDKYDKLAYINKSSNIFIYRDLYGNPVESLKQVIEDGKNYSRLHFYVVLNSNNVTGTNVTIGETTTIKQLKALTFSGIVQSTTVSGETTPKKDNQMIMYGYNSLEIGTRTEYKLSIEVERAVAKLEMFFTKESTGSNLSITSVSLTNVPNMGSLLKTFDFPENTLSYSTEETNLFNGSANITTALETDNLLGEFSNYESSFQKLQLASPYLLENSNGKTWGRDKNDFTYPENPNGAENVYKLTVKYILNRIEKEQIIYLPTIVRNHLYKIYARVLGTNDVQFKLAVQPWTDVNITVPFNNIVSYTVTGWEDNDKLYGNDYYIAKAGNAVLKFQINNPENCDYIVKLSDNTNFTYTKGKDGDNETITISPVNTMPEQYNGKEYETTLSVYAVRSDNGKLVELDMTKSGPSSTGSGTINHYTIKQQWTN